MTSKSDARLLRQVLELLTQHFGERAVRNALLQLRIDLGHGKRSAVGVTRAARGIRKSTEPTVVQALSAIKDTEPDKFRLLEDFYAQLRARRVLPESEDIRHFAQNVGLKEIQGKARRDIVPVLMRFLIGQPFNKLQGALAGASAITEQQRQRGFAVLTDKLLGQK